MTAYTNTTMVHTREGAFVEDAYRLRMGHPDCEMALRVHEASLTPRPRRITHPTTYYSTQLTGVEYRAYRPYLAAIGVELLRDEQVLRYRGFDYAEVYQITVTTAGVAKLEQLTNGQMICPLYIGEMMRDGYPRDSRWDDIDGEPVYRGERVAIIDGCDFAECCGNTLISSHKRIVCPTCGRINYGD